MAADRVDQAHEAEPSKYVLSTLPEDTPINELVGVAYQRWRIERDYQDLKQDFGLGHYEGRGWRGFHHHASRDRGLRVPDGRTLNAPQSAAKTTSSNTRCLPFPRITSPAAALRAQRHVGHSITTLRHQLSYALIAHLGQCPCCGKASERLIL